MPNAKALDQLLTAAWERMAWAKERWNYTGLIADYEAYRCTCAYVDALENARQVFKGGALPDWAEQRHIETKRRTVYDDDAGVPYADPT